MSVVVLGMHRSGTSAAAGALRAAGLEVPDDSYLKPLARDELKGFFEPLELVELNEELLVRLGGDWSAPPADTEWTDPTISTLRARAADTFQRVMPPERWLWKDPRTCLTLPFWLDALDVRPHILFVYRDPREVARSLAQRARFSPFVGLALWERYVRDALANMAGLRVVVTNCQELRDDPLRWTREVTEALASLGMPLEGLDDDAVLRFFESPLARLSLHVDSPAEELPSAEQEELLATIRSLNTCTDPFPTLDLPAFTPWAQALLDERRRHLDERKTQTVRMQDLRDRLRHLNRQNRRLQEGNQRIQEKNQRLQQENRLLRQRNPRVPLWKRTGRSAYRRIRRMTSRSARR